MALSSNGLGYETFTLVMSGSIPTKATRRTYNGFGTAQSD